MASDAQWMGPSGAPGATRPIGPNSDPGFRRLLASPLRYSVLALIVWSLAVAFVVPWRAPGPGAIFRNWLAPGLLAGAAMGVFGLLTQSDYFLVAIVIVASLCSAAWAQSPVCTAASHAAVSTED